MGILQDSFVGVIGTHSQSLLDHHNSTNTAALTQLPAVLSLHPAALSVSPALPPPLQG